MRIIFFLILVISILPADLRAQSSDLYVGSVPVADQSSSERDAAFPAALLQVLGKLSGQRDLSEIPEVAVAVAQARSLVVSFHYEQLDVASENSSSPLAEDESQTFLAARFAQAGTDEMLQLLGLPRWRAERDPLSMWLLIDDGLRRQVLPLEYEYLREPLDRTANDRGLPLDWPTPGEDGSYGVDVQLLWGGYTEQLDTEGQADNILIIAARREGPEWSTRQILAYGGDNWSWRNRNISLEAGLSDVMNRVVDEIASGQAIAASEQGSWIHQISVSGLNSGNDYLRCIEYLESLSVIDEVSVVTADPFSVTLVMELNVAPDYLDRLLDSDQVLESEDGSGHYVLQK